VVVLEMTVQFLKEWIAFILFIIKKRMLGPTKYG